MKIKELIDLLSEHAYPDNEIIIFFDEVEHTVATAALITGGIEHNTESQLLMWLVEKDAEVIIE